MSNPIMTALFSYASAGALTLTAFAVGLSRHYRRQSVARRGFRVRPRP